MPAEPRYLSLPDVVALHEFVMLRFGEAPSVLRDEGALDSAVNRPAMAAYYQGADLIEQAALLAVGVSHAQAFVDGNKRTAYLSARVFLELNGLTLTGEPLDLARWIETIAGSPRDPALQTGFVDWLRAHVAGVGPAPSDDP